MNQHVLCLNAGSSSLKFALYDLHDLEKVLMSGAAEKIGMQPSRLKIKLMGHSFLNENIAIPTHEQAVLELLAAVNRARLPKPTACVHRVVHGGPHLIDPVLITGNVKHELDRLSALAPLHIPIELSVIEAAARAYPDSSQVACFDTAFHHRMPEIAKRFPLPRTLWDEGIRRYGFHGLSYESIVAQLGNQLAGRSIIAHLGNGCSMVALKDGVPQDTTMGLTPTGGLMMGTRAGDLDPGVLLYLMRRSSDHVLDLSEPTDRVARVERLLNDESGLLGVSGISRNMEDLLQLDTESVAAREAIDLFCYCAKKFIGSLYSVLGGLDTLVFTGGIGENSPVVRRRICEELGVFGIRMDPAQNESNSPIINHGHSHCTIRVLKTNENLVMARHASSVLYDNVAKSKTPMVAKGEK